MNKQISERYSDKLACFCPVCRLGNDRQLTFHPDCKKWFKIVVVETDSMGRELRDGNRKPNHRRSVK